MKETSKFAKFLGAMGTVIKDINPLEHVGTLVAGKVKESSFEGLVANYSSSIARNVISSLSDAFEVEIVLPLQQNLNDQKVALEEEEKKRVQGYQKFNTERSELEDNIKKISRMVDNV
ncbi:hypothetical protein [Fibrobacter sp.]|uniref:hypothetical protein n=1 Tax=Fibrobacter sp. TaxID=35828 RepID=UPI002622C816|nr:hypothetical protein [Fibrobacter sp.]MDD5941098.1 hypothetical protein [Fibrobacter sp.]